MEKISILLPTRKRFTAFCNSVDSLFNTAHNIDNFEILIALDSDDIETIDLVSNFIQNKQNMIIFKCDRKHYHNLHLYYNALAAESSGTSLFLWNDDSIMMSKNWDIEILKYHKTFCVLSPKVINMENYWLNQGVLFPIIPKKWVELTGFWAPYRGCDSWIDYLGKKLNLIRNIDTILIQHDRYDITGNNNDETYREGRGGGEDIVKYNDILNQHYETIKKYLNDNN